MVFEVAGIPKSCQQCFPFAYIPKVAAAKGGDGDRKTLFLTHTEFAGVLYVCGGAVVANAHNLVLFRFTGFDGFLYESFVKFDWDQLA